MKKLVYVLLLALSIGQMACKDKMENLSGIDFRQEMRNFVIKISNYAKAQKSDFIIIPQNGQALITAEGEASGTLESTYIAAINGCGREDLFYGYNNDNEPTPAEDKQQMLSLCLLFEQNGLQVLTTDYCSTHSKMNDSYQQNNKNNFISFAADERNLNDIPTYPSPIYNENSDDITKLLEAKNFIYLINGENYTNKQAFINAVSETNYDVILMDLFQKETTFSASEINNLKTKKNGAKRLVIAYMSIGEAEDYRYYWQKSWNKNKPDWLREENPDWKGNYKVYYWNSDWQALIFGNENAYLDKILAAGFDGVYLDIIDGYEYFEN